MIDDGLGMYVWSALCGDDHDHDHDQDQDGDSWGHGKHLGVHNSSNNYHIKTSFKDRMT